MRKREPKHYNDDNLAIAAALARAESENKLLTKGCDHEAAKAANLPPYQLADFEKTCSAIPDTLRRKPARLCSIRNHMLGRAQRAPTRYMTLAEAVKGLDASFQKQPASAGSDAADAAAVFECLNHHGIINWGVLDDHPRLASKPRQARSVEAPCVHRKRVVVIGAGASGLAAARQLHMLGHHVTVLEARERIGGRVHTVGLHCGSGIGSADMGAMVVTGTEGNPIATLAKQTRSRMHRINNKCRIYGLDGRPVAEALDSALENEWNTLLDRCKAEAAPEPTPDMSLGSKLRSLVRSRAPFYAKVEAEVMAASAARQARAEDEDDDAGVNGAVSSGVHNDGEVPVSAHRCERCRKCFASVDRLDRHRLVCLDAEAAAQVVVRSDKAFSGYEGVVESRVGKGDKWEAYYVQSLGYGRKRRRVGDTFDTAEEAARAYATACRVWMLEEKAEAVATARAEGGGGGRGGRAGGSGGAVMEVEALSDSDSRDDEGEGEGAGAGSSVGGAGGSRTTMGEYEVGADPPLASSLRASPSPYLLSAPQSCLPTPHAIVPLRALLAVRR